MTTLNMMGKPCPIPVVEAKKALARPETREIIVLVDNRIAVQNLEKMAAGLGHDFSFEQKGDEEFAVTITAKGGSISSADTVCEDAAANSGGNTCDCTSGITYLITANQLGAGEAEPSQKLLKSFLLSLSQMPVPPRAILFLNTGVKLAAEGTYALDELQALAGQGTVILACGQCLTYYGLIDKLVAGRVSNMLEIVEMITSSARTVTV